MPCRDDYPTREQEEIYTLTNRVEKLTRSNDRMARMLCDLCGRLERHHSEHFIGVNAELSQWWNEHKIQDEKRLMDEENAKRKAARKHELLSALSDEDKEILGIKK